MAENDKTTSIRDRALQAWADRSPDRAIRLREAADEARLEMERQSERVRELIVAQPPVQLLGYLWAQFHMGILAGVRNEDEYRPDKDLIQKFQFALEYAHAVWSCHAVLPAETAELDQTNAEALLEALGALKTTTMHYCMVSSAAKMEAEGHEHFSDMEFHAKSAWVLIRGNRYQSLEEEFFAFVLEPHADALLAAYGMSCFEIASAIQDIANTMRVGFSRAVEKLREGMERANTLVESDVGLGAAIEKLKQADGSFAPEMAGAIDDVFRGGICSLSRHTKCSPALLEDLSYVPGGNTEFFADGEFKGTPMRTLPALIRPGIKLGDEYFATDGQFIRDAAYRCIQRGLLGRLPTYREEWNRRQKSLIEQSYPKIFADQLSQARKFAEVYFKDSHTGQWVESDLVVMLEDVLLIVEAKAGVMAMHSPATNFDRHVRAIRELIVKAYEQCKRLMEYLASAPEVPLYNRVEGKYVEVVRLRQRDFRTIVPIGLTVEAFTPFSAVSKELDGIEPILGKHPFVSMSVDDLFVLNRFLPTTGELLHYLEVRQQAAGIPKSLLFDEIEHLGAYISQNRFDMKIQDQLKEADMVTWDSFGGAVDKYFEGETWQVASPPHQDYPGELTTLLGALDRLRPAGWLVIDSHIRNLSGEGRQNLAGYLRKLVATLQDHSIRRFLLAGDERSLQVWLCREPAKPWAEDVLYQGQVGCLAFGTSDVLILRISYDNRGEIVDVACSTCRSPPVIQTNFAELKREAERQRARTSEIKRRDKFQER